MRMEFVGTNEECDAAREIHRVLEAAIDYSAGRLKEEDSQFIQTRMMRMSRIKDAAAWIAAEDELLGLSIDFLLMVQREQADSDDI